jgi:predicted  nucleic acid-binding Zn-ribbon protein
MGKKLFPYLITLTALTVSGSAAYYSVTGLSKLFAGASLAVMIMAGSLEVAKLVVATILHRYWGTINKVLRAYLTLATVILILITSAGIYGFLSSAYQETATKSKVVDKQVELLESRKSSFSKIKTQYETEKQSITENISNLRNALGNNTQSYVDKNGNVITYSSSANRRVFEQQLETAVAKDEKLTEKIQTLNDSILNLETQVVVASSNSELTSELGPLKYLSGLTGKPMDKIINILLLVIIFVFDPLAIALVVTASFAFKQASKKEEPVVKEEVVDIPEKNWVEDWPNGNDEELERASLEDFNNFNEEWVEEPYEIYVSGSQNASLEKQARHTDWEIIDEEKENQKETLEQEMKQIQEKAAKLQVNPNYSSWRKKKELEMLSKDYTTLQNRRKALDKDDDLVIKYT